MQIYKHTHTHCYNTSQITKQNTTSLARRHDTAFRCDLIIEVRSHVNYVVTVLLLSDLNALCNFVIKVLDALHLSETNILSQGVTS